MTVVYQGLYFSFINLSHESAWRPHNLTGKYVLEGEGQGLVAGKMSPLVFQRKPRRKHFPFNHRWLPTKVRCSELGYTHWEYL